MHARRTSLRTTVALATMCFALGSGLAAQKNRGPTDPAKVPRVKPEELQKLQAKAQVVLVDVRTPQAFAAGHLDGAVNIPATDIETRAADLRRLAGTRRIVLYCSCAFEHSAADAAVRLARLGVTKVSVLSGGYRGEEAHDT